MNKSRQFHNIALVGFMGVAKTTVGQLLAQHLQFELIDTDRVIEQRENRKVSEIFAQRGEPYFRALEASLAAELEARRGAIISTGGGMVVNPVNLQSLQQHSLVACLWASPEVIYERVKSQTHRPLLQTPNPLEKIREMLAARRAHYLKADVIVGVDYRSPLETARHVASSFRRAAGGGGGK